MKFSLEKSFVLVKGEARPQSYELLYYFQHCGYSSSHSTIIK